jgi:hypothetical protein
MVAPPWIATENATLFTGQLLLEDRSLLTPLEKSKAESSERR